MDSEQLVRHFSTVNSVGLESHGGKIGGWAKGQIALLEDEMTGLRARMTQCHAELEAQKDVRELAAVIAFRRDLLLAFIRSTQNILGANSIYKTKLGKWVVELGDMEVTVPHIDTQC